jgi:hypothetical protein
MSNATSVAVSENLIGRHMPCYGKLFPSVHPPAARTERTGAVFGYAFEPPGAVSLAPAVTIDLDAWDRCVQCPEFSNCRNLSSAKLMLEMALNA